MVEGDDPGDATQHGITDVMKGTDSGASQDSGALPTCGGDQGRYAWNVERDNAQYTGWSFPIYDRALGKIVAVCSEQYMATRLCKKLNEHKHGD